MPFSCQLKFPPFNGAPIEAAFVSWKAENFGMLEKGDAIAEIIVSNATHELCVNFPCGFISKKVVQGTIVATGDLIAGCGADGESIPYGQDYLFIR